MLTRQACAAVAGLVTLIISSAAAATPVAVANASFEAQQFANPDGYEFSAPPQGWRSAAVEAGSISGVGYWRPTPTSFDYVPDGNNIAYVFSADRLFQVLDADLAANTRYTLSVDIGYRRTLGAGDMSGAVQLWAGTSLLEEAVATVLSGPGGWGTLTLEFTSDLAVAAGQKLGIHLVHLGAHSAYFDNVRLDAETLALPVETPEPGMLALLGLGLGSAAVLRRRSTQGS